MPTGVEATAIVSIGDRVPSGDYVVHSRFARVVNFINATALVTVAAPQVGRGPLTITVNTVVPGACDRLSVRPDHIRLGRQVLPLDRRRTFRSHYPMSAPRARRIAGSLDTFAAELSAAATPQGLAFLLAAESPAVPLTAFERTLRARLTAGVAALFSATPLAGIRKLRGLGYGLTPSGDDFIAGFLAALPVLECLQQVSLERLRNRVLGAARSGNQLVNAFLQMAGDACYFARFRALLVALARGRAPAVRMATRGLLAMGETSGCDMGVGFIMTVRQGGVLCR